MSDDQHEDNPTKALEIVTPEPSADAMRKAITTYKEIQAVFDEKMPDSIMVIGDKKFRKKDYWRGIAAAFHLKCEIVSADRLDELPGDASADWGFAAIVRATTPDGRTSDGDGSCMASEKWTTRPQCPSCGSAEASFRSKNAEDPDFYCWKKKGGCGHTWDADPDAPQAIDKSQATVHNVRSHAVTRAKNRAISDLVGFGEVSADELPTGSFSDSVDSAKPRGPSNTPVPEGRQPAQTRAPAGDSNTRKPATPAQLKMLSAKAGAQAAKLLDIAEGEGMKQDEDYHNKKTLAAEVKRLARERVGCGKEITRGEVDPLIVAIESAGLDIEGVVTLYPSAARE